MITKEVTVKIKAKDEKEIADAEKAINLALEKFGPKGLSRLMEIYEKDMGAKIAIKSKLGLY